MSYKSTLLPDYVSVIQATSIGFYNNGTNILDAIGGYLAELNTNINFAKAKVTPDLLTAYGTLFNELNASNFTVLQYDADGAEIGVKEMDDSFKLFFIEKFQSLSAAYKEQVSTLISGNTFFVPFSDDVGNVSDTVSFFDNSVNPIYDVNNSQYFLQTNLPASLFNKVSVNELQVLKTFSFYGDALLKHNLSRLQSGVSKITAATSHGQNLVTDILAYERVVLSQLPILNTLKLILGNMGDMIMFFKQLNPKDQDPNRKAVLFKYTQTNMEGISLKVDALQRVLEQTQRSTASVLQ